MLEKILKNTTGSDIFLEFPGITVPASGQVTINVEEYKDIAAESALITELTPLINSGDIVVNNGTVDYSAADGIRFLEYPDRLTVQEGGTDTTIVTKSINFTGSAATTDQGDGNVDIEVGATLFGALWQLAYTEDGDADNEWLGLYDRGNKSNQTFGVIPFDSEICVITYSNSKGGSDCDIELHLADAGDDNNNVKIYNWEIRDKRVDCVSTFTTPIQVNAGDKLGVYCQDQGTDAKNVAVVIYFRIINTNKCDSGENFSGNFSSVIPGTT
jgi:hypothetical protein